MDLGRSTVGARVFFFGNCTSLTRTQGTSVEVKAEVLECLMMHEESFQLYEQEALARP